MFFFAIWISSLMKCLFRTLTHLKNCAVFLLVIFDNSLHILDSSSLLDICVAKIFLLACALCFHFLISVFCYRVLSPFYQFVVLWTELLLPKSRSQKVSPVFRSFIMWGLTFRPMTPLELIFVYGVRYGSEYIAVARGWPGRWWQRRERKEARRRLWSPSNPLYMYLFLCPSLK